ncbi:hypothetical protein BHU72_00550 [Desulfuribacillus stibiiarsenatis]|uniref:Uncharacterized protein n=2 Tax=Desulfuribacillus stibiiarsenatis TaxID=1390249 RepID=A0A1E5LA98_9FIRM|nr:hypothetical protein BHU72_00550 [Desulfuribacillus stibiiarsenatis]
MHGSANQMLELQTKMDAIKKRQSESQAKAKDIQQGINSVKQQERSVVTQINQIHHEIELKELELNQLTLDIEQTETQIEITTLELQEAEQRIINRDSVLKSRVRSMYENGQVSYLEVLLGSSDFVDFLNRYEALSLIVEQDFRILKEDQQDRDMIQVKKDEIEEQFAQLQSLKEQAEFAKADLSDKEKKQKVELAELKDNRSSLQKQLDEEEAAQKKLIQELNEVTKQFQRIYRGTGAFTHPVPEHTRMSSNYGTRVDPITGKKGVWHNGVDFAAKTGTPILAAEDGVVILSGWVRGFGYTVILDHGSQITTLYGHASQLLVKEGQTVQRGQQIAKVGSTGNSTGPHLHFTVYENGKDVSPWNYIKQ